LYGRVRRIGFLKGSSDMMRRVENPSKKRVAHGTLFELIRTSWAK